MDCRQASTSMLQRRLKLGYSRAARIIDQIEDRGIIGPSEGSKPRQILISREDWQEMKLRRTGEKKEVALDALAEMMGFARRAMRDNVLHGAGTGAFAAIFG